MLKLGVWASKSNKLYRRVCRVYDVMLRIKEKGSFTIGIYPVPLSRHVEKEMVAVLKFLNNDQK